MRITTIDLENLKYSKTPVVACIGYFDGMHKGHQALINKTIELAREKNCDTGLITFDPDPWVTIKDLKFVTHITTMQQRIQLAASFGIHNIYILKFTKAMSALSPQDFEQKVLGSINLQGIVCGFDFHYAAKGAGNCDTLKEHLPVQVEVVEEVEDEIGKISSTRITNLIREGKVDEAEELLSYPYEIQGKVVHGRYKGHLLGFPTANVKASAEYIKPKPGVYAGYVVVRDKKYMAMINYGHNPTMNFTDDLSMEAYLLDFNQDIYGERVTLQFKKFLRREIHFKNVGNLIMQLEQDCRDVRQLLSK